MLWFFAESGDSFASMCGANSITDSEPIRAGAQLNRLSPYFALAAFLEKSDQNSKVPLEKLLPSLP
jgi:hypothetical protein